MHKEVDQRNRTKAKKAQKAQFLVNWLSDIVSFPGQHQAVYRTRVGVWYKMLTAL